jgi:hypothetical protein
MSAVQIDPQKRTGVEFRGKTGRRRFKFAEGGNLHFGFRFICLQKSQTNGPEGAGAAGCEKVLRHFGSPN